MGAGAAMGRRAGPASRAQCSDRLLPSPRAAPRRSAGLSPRGPTAAHSPSAPLPVSPGMAPRGTTRRPPAGVTRSGHASCRCRPVSAPCRSLRTSTPCPSLARAWPRPRAPLPGHVPGGLAACRARPARATPGLGPGGGHARPTRRDRPRGPRRLRPLPLPACEHPQAPGSARRWARPVPRHKTPGHGVDTSPPPRRRLAPPLPPAWPPQGMPHRPRLRPRAPPPSHRAPTAPDAPRRWPQPRPGGGACPRPPPAPAQSQPHAGTARSGLGRAPDLPRAARAIPPRAPRGTAPPAQTPAVIAWTASLPCAEACRPLTARPPRTAMASAWHPTGRGPLAPPSPPQVMRPQGCPLLPTPSLAPLGSRRMVPLRSSAAPARHGTSKRLSAPPSACSTQHGVAACSVPG